MRPADGVFVGREGPLGDLVDDIATARATGASTIAVVTGEAGIGKTALTRALVRRFPDLAVIRFGATPIIGDVWHGDPPVSDVSDLTIVVVEDLHWCSPESADALARFVAEVDVLPVALLLTARPAPHDPHVGHLLELATRAGARLIELEAMDPSEVAAMASGALGRAPTPALTDWLARAGGNPLLVAELLKDAADGEPGRDVPPALGGIVRHRIDSLGEPVRRWIYAAALLSTFRIDDLVALTGAVDPRSVGDAIAAGLLVDDGVVLRFRHDLLREAIAGDLAPSVAAAIHRRIARYLDDGAGEPAAIAHHAERAALTSADDQAWLVDVAVRLSRLIGMRSVPLLRRAAAGLDHSDPRRHQVLASSIIPLAASGAVAEAERVLREVEPLDLPTDVRDQVTSARLFLLTPHADALEAAVADVLDDPAATAMAKATALLRVSVLHAVIGRVRDASAEARAALALDDLGRRPFLEALAAIDVAGAGDIEGALASCPAPTPGPSASMVGLVRGCLLVDLDELDGAVDHLAGAAAFEADREPAFVVYIRAVLAFTHLLAGDWRSAQLEAGRVRDLQGEVTLDFRTRSLVEAVELRIAILVYGTAPQPIPSAPAERMLFGELRAWALALGADDGSSTAPLDLLRQAWAHAHEARLILTWRSVAPDLLRLARRAGDLELVEEILEVAATGQGRCRALSASAAAQRCQGLATDDVDALVSAAGAFDASGRPFDATASVLEAANALRAADPRGARRLLQDALDRYDALGATAAASMVALRLGRGRRPSRVVSGWDALSPAERRVVALVSRGLTNREIAATLHLSRHTVGTHLRHVFAKLGVRSRAAVAAIAVQHDHA